MSNYIDRSPMFFSFENNVQMPQGSFTTRPLSIPWQISPDDGIVRHAPFISVRCENLGQLVLKPEALYCNGTKTNPQFPPIRGLLRAVAQVSAAEPDKVYPQRQDLFWSLLVLFRQWSSTAHRARGGATLDSCRPAPHINIKKHISALRCAFRNTGPRDADCTRQVYN